MTGPVLQTGRLTLRRPVPRDWDAFRDFMMSERAAEFGSHRNLGKAFRSFAAELGHWDIFGFGMFAVTRTGEDRAVALVGPWNPPDWPERELGWMVLDGAAEGQGIAREAAEGALRHIWSELKWDTVVSYIAQGNARSVALAERLGARLDPRAAAPDAPGKTVLVYRHPRPEALA
ncbi:GNAT family N-acetyltransferase [Rubellimicrobium roseum]|uniref:GNAT family N-acetyltransferase n=1 Tax=Rubellimicrobium roseum TaxID=687525 RepID=A0A5C4NC16_9RHOB|nr:GNAT family N-acetyltransferase [Rubellimicrobium roseum]TNC68795.1 GNAT family N-acetyltransferase [Rubellimicrobium roseum]